MKVKLVVNDEKYDELKLLFENMGMSIDNKDFEYSFIESNYNVNKMFGYKNEEMFIVKPHDVVYIESYSGEVVCHTNNETLLIKYKLYELENMFENYGFMRVSNSYVVNLNKVKSITPTINRKFILRMVTDDKVEVTRSYYYKFKEFIEG